MPFLTTGPSLGTGVAVEPSSSDYLGEVGVLVEAPVMPSREGSFPQGPGGRISPPSGCSDSLPDITNGTPVTGLNASCGHNMEEEETGSPESYNSPE